MTRATVGSSELAVTLGLQARRADGTPYTSELALWCRLRGLLPRYDTGSTTPAAEAGKIAEPGILLRAGRELGMYVLPGPTLDEPGWSHPDLPWLAVRPDGQASKPETGGWSALIEAKAPKELGAEWGNAGSSDVPVGVVVASPTLSVPRRV